MKLIGIDPGEDFGFSILEGIPGKMKLVSASSWGSYKSFNDLYRVLKNLEILLWDLDNIRFTSRAVDVLAIEQSWKGKMSHADLEVLCQRTGIFKGFFLHANPEIRIIDVPVGPLNTRGKKRGGKTVKGWKEDLSIGGETLKGKGDEGVLKYVEIVEGWEASTVHEACSICIGRWGERVLVTDAYLAR